MLLCVQVLVDWIDANVAEDISACAIVSSATGRVVYPFEDGPPNVRLADVGLAGRCSLLLRPRKSNV